MQILLEGILLRTYDSQNIEDQAIIQKFPVKEDKNSFIHSIGTRLMQNNRSKNFPFQTAFFVESRGNVVGYLYISSIRNDEVYLEYFILEEYRRQGYGKCLLGSVTRYLETNYNIRKLKLDIDPSNQNSLNLALSCGFELEEEDYQNCGMNGRMQFSRDNYYYVDKKRATTRR